MLKSSPITDRSVNDTPEAAEQVAQKPKPPSTRNHASIEETWVSISMSET